jgi:hypothetical protein
METKDITVSLILGIATGLWVAFLHLCFSKTNIFNKLLRIVIMFFAPSIGWFVGAFCVLFFAGSHIPDWIGMAILTSGSIVFLASIITTTVSLNTTTLQRIFISALSSTIILHGILIFLNF